jgi:hypothetical protein
VDAPDAAQVERELAVIRRLRRRVWILFWLYLPVVGGTGVLIERARPSGKDALIMSIALLWMLAYGYTGVRVGWSRCPRCKRRFHSKRGFFYMFARRCVHCALPLDGGDLS